MCIVVYAADSHPKYKLILVSNRDEFLHRPTSPAVWRDGLIGKSSASANADNGSVLCGLDTVGGGTWLGLAKDGRLGVLTNFTEPPPATPPARSRGVILADYLSPPLPNDHQSVPSPLDFLRSSLAPTAHDFAGFNVILFSLFPTSMLGKSASSTSPLEERSASEPDSPVEIGYLSNRSVPPDRIALGSHPAEPAPVERVTARIGGLSNSLLGDPWPKVCDSERGLIALLLEEQDDAQHECPTRNGVARQSWSEDKWIERLEQLMSHSVPTIDRSTFRSSTSIPPVRLPSTSAPPTNALPTPESPEAIDKWYATRLTTTVLITHAGEFFFAERDRWTLGEGDQPVMADARSRRVFRGRLAVPSQPFTQGQQT